MKSFAKRICIYADLFTEMTQCVSYLSYTLMHVKSNMQHACLHIMSHSSVVHLGQRAHIQRIMKRFNLLPSRD